MTDQDRAEFEAWAIATYDIKGGPYNNAMNAWLAARQNHNKQLDELLAAVEGLGDLRATRGDLHGVLELAARIRAERNPTTTEGDNG